MGFLDAIFSRRVTPDAQVVSQALPLDIPFAVGKDVIMVDPDRPLPDCKSRPPIVFENGLR